MKLLHIRKICIKLTLEVTICLWNNAGKLIIWMMSKEENMFLTKMTTGEQISKIFLPKNHCCILDF